MAAKKRLLPNITSPGRGQHSELKVWFLVNAFPHDHVERSLCRFYMAHGGCLCVLEIGWETLLTDREFSEESRTLIIISGSSKNLVPGLFACLTVAMGAKAKYILIF